MFRTLLSTALILGAAAGAALMAPAGPAAAQENESVAAFRDWSVFNAADPRECYVVTPPTSTRALRGGDEVSVRRGDILLFVTIRPGQGVDKEVSFTGGYPFRDGSEIEVEIGDDSFSMAPGSGESEQWAWPPTPENDAELVEAMRGGVTAVITAVSSRGTTTVDSFSLMGFTNALEEAERLCQ